LNLSKLKKVLIVRLSSLGDILLSTPLIRALKEKYPQIEIDFLLKERYKDTLVQNPYLTKIYKYPNTNELSELIEKLKAQNYDLILDLQNNFRSEKINSLFNVLKLKFKKRDLEKILLVHLKINRLKNAPPIPVRYSKVLDEFQLDDRGLDLFTNREPSTLFKDNQKYIGFCPGSRHFTKMWPKEYYIQLGNILKKEKYNIVLFGGKEDIDICKKISSQIQDSINLSNNDDILQTAADMKKCRAVVCNDSGLMHTACAEKVPVLAFFGSTVKEFGFAPYMNKNIILENNSLSCRPCTHIGKSYCPKRHFKCMLELKPDIAFIKLNLLLNS
jgi:lipopolysaccharide heptosyltransferase II